YNLGHAYSDMRQHQEAVAAYQEALQIYRVLARNNPTEYEPRVTATLGALAGVPESTDQTSHAVNGKHPNIWIDPATGLMWTKRDNGEGLSHSDALKYCADLRLGGFTNWRLPEIRELAGLYDGTLVSGNVRLFNVVPFDLHVRGGIQVTGLWVWSATQNGNSKEFRVFRFYDGTRFSAEVGNWNYRALCVKNP
ncbi:MAG: DUF1566 domain-containing protein, partial [Candidatus Korobacteraceae bacterium]